MIIRINFLFEVSCSKYQLLVLYRKAQGVSENGIAVVYKGNEKGRAIKNVDAVCV
jgi:hypothetical protein